MQTFTTADGRTYEDRLYETTGSVCMKCAFATRQRSTGCRSSRCSNEPCCFLGYY